MAEFKKLSEVELLETSSETANVLIEEDGEIKRVPKSAVGGAGGGLPTVIIKDSMYDNAIAGVMATPAAAPEVEYACINMTFEDAYQTMSMGEPLNVILMLGNTDAPTCISGGLMLGTGFFGMPCIIIGEAVTLFWTPDGLSTQEPGGGK